MGAHPRSLSLSASLLLRSRSAAAVKHNPCALIQPCELQACCRALAPLSCARRPTHTVRCVSNCVYVSRTVSLGEALQRHVAFYYLLLVLMKSLSPTPRNLCCNAMFSESRTRKSASRRSFKSELQVGKVRLTWVCQYKHTWRHSNTAAHTVNQAEWHFTSFYFIFVLQHCSCHFHSVHLYLT